MEIYDIAVLGGGIAGLSAAIHASELGGKVCLIEKEHIGGACFRSYYPLRMAMTSAVTGRGMLENTKGLASAISSRWLETIKSKRVVYKNGNGVLINNTEIMIGSEGREEVIKAGKIIIATGSVPIPSPSMPFDGETVLSPDDVISMREIPENILIVGGDRVGCELATLFNRWGSKVFLCDPRSHVIGEQDPDIITALEEELKKQKIKLLLNRKPVSMFKEGGKVDITLDGEIKLSTDKIILSGARKSNTGNLDAARLGLRLGERNEVLVNEKMESSVPGIYAVGSVTGSCPDPVLSEEGGRVAAKNAMGKDRTLNLDHVPVITHTDPEIVSVGCSVKNAQYKGFRAVEGRCDYNALDHSLVSGETVGLFKVVADKTTKKVIGVHIFGRGASEMITLAALAIKKGLAVSDLAALSCGWPTRFQGFKRAARMCLDNLSSRPSD